MGTNLILRHKSNPDIRADLGRAHQLEDLEDLYEHVGQLKMYAAYTPRHINEMRESADMIDYLVGEIKKIGARELLDYILLDDEWETVKE